MLRADFLRFYGVEVDDVDISDIGEMIASMPRGARTLMLIDERTAWTDAEYMLSEILYKLDVIAHGMMLEGSPRRLPIPGDKPRKRRPREEVKKIIMETDWVDADAS